MFQGIKCIVQGADHIARNKICQDAADFIIGEHYAAAIVADGHGSEKYIRSEIGSKKAVQAAIDTIKAYMRDYFRFQSSIKKDSDYILTKMEEQFLARWSQYIEDHFIRNPLTEAESNILKKEKAESRDIYSYYGTTVLIAVMAENFCYGMLVGDGGFVVVESGGKVKIPIEDQNSYANYVSSICSRNAILAFQEFYEESQPLSICVSTDGLIKSFDSEEDFKEYHVRLTTMLANIENCQISLEKNLNIRTQNGSGDDISVAAVFDPFMISKEKKDLEDYIKEEQKLKNQRQKKEMLERRQKETELQLRKNSENPKKCEAQEEKEKSFRQTDSSQKKYIESCLSNQNKPLLDQSIGNQTKSVLLPPPQQAMRLTQNMMSQQSVRPVQNIRTPQQSIRLVQDIQLQQQTWRSMQNSSDSKKYIDGDK